MSDHYILDGHEVVKADDLMSWAKWLETSRDECRVASTGIGDVRVSTVFLGLDHQYGDGPPLLFETMVFAPNECYCERCSTWEQAEAEHEKAVAWVNNGMQGRYDEQGD